MNDSKEPKLIQTKWGFFQYDPMPSDQELEGYYAEKYFQEGRGSYSVSYSPEEISWFRLKAGLVRRKVFQLVGSGTSSLNMLDVGCGEGWLMDEFKQHGAGVGGIDFSEHGIRKFHPDLLPFFEQGNMYSLLSDKVAAGAQFDLVTLANVIEHVKDPVQILTDVKKLLNEESILIIVAPNDFSRLHQHLLEKKYVERQWWLYYPDHLSYFNKESMCCLLDDLGLEVRAVVADNPIDLTLLNDNSNYIMDPDKGRSTHMYRVRHDNFLGEMDPDGLLKMYEVLGGMGVGRDLTYYCSVRL